MTIELVTTDGFFTLDGGEWAVTNNIWLVGNEREVIVLDAANDAETIMGAIDGRRVRAIVLTHGHNDHINAAVPLREFVDAPIWLHEADRMLWDVVWPDDAPDRALVPGDVLKVAGHARAHDPAHRPRRKHHHRRRTRQPNIYVAFGFLARLGATRGGSPAILGYTGGHGASGNPAA